MRCGRCTLPVSGFEIAREDLEEGRLARAVRSGHAVAPTAAERDRHVREQPLLTVTLADLLNLNRRHGVALLAGSRQNPPADVLPASSPGIHARLGLTTERARVRMARKGTSPPELDLAGARRAGYAARMSAKVHGKKAPAEQDASAKKPLKQPSILFERTQRLITELEKALGGALLTYWNNPRGSVCHSDVIALYQALRACRDLGHHLPVLKSDGGNGQASLRIVNLMRKHCKKLVALVPLECASAATMIALGANEIHMGPMAYLTAVDTSLTHDLSPVDRDNDRVSVSLDELRRVVAPLAERKEHR